jgi:hypothetical protein
MLSLDLVDRQLAFKPSASALPSAFSAQAQTGIPAFSATAVAAHRGAFAGAEPLWINISIDIVDIWRES